MHEDHIQFPRQERRATILRFPSITGVILEELALILQCSRDLFVRIDSALSSVDHWHVSESKWDTKQMGRS